MSTVSRPAPHAVMIVGNDVTVDTRVRKMATSVAMLGVDVTVVGLSTSGAREEATMGDVRIVRVPVQYRLRDARRERLRREALADELRKADRAAAWWSRAGRALSHWWHETVPWSIPDLSPAELNEYGLRHQLAQRELNSEVGRLRQRSRELTARSDSRLIRGLVRRWFGMRVARVKSRARVRAERHRARLERYHRRRSGPEPLGPEERTPRIRPWREWLPEFEDYELAIGPVLDELEPDLIHAHDVHCIGLAERAAMRAAAAGRQVKLIYDAHEFVGGLSRYDEDVLGAHVDLEQEYIHRFDEIITVSDPLAALLRDQYDLADLPTVVLNAPLLAADRAVGARDVRSDCGLDQDTPLAVYSGGMDHTRGVHTLVRAMAEVPGLHVALVRKRMFAYIEGLVELARELGCEDRLHLLPFVSPDEVSHFLSTATVGVHTLVAGYLNHEIALPNKLFEYMHAGLPVVVSDCEAMARFVGEHGNGQVYRSEDPNSLAEALRTVIADPARFTEPYRTTDVLEEHSWLGQQRRLAQVYERVLGTPFERPESAPASLAEVHEQGRGDGVGIAGTRRGLRSLPSRFSLVIGPSNTAGQGWEWAQALRQAAPAATVEVLELERPSGMAFPADRQILAAEWRNLSWQLEHTQHVLTTATHVLMEAGRGILGRLNGGYFDQDLPALTAHGIAPALVLHGSEVREPARHRELVEYSPFANAQDSLTRQLQERTTEVLARVRATDIPVFVTTKDLLDHVPDAVWLPTVIDPTEWRGASEPLERDVLRVAHVPTSGPLKGSAFVDQVCRELEYEGLIEYVRFEGIPYEQMPGLLRSVDVVVDGLVLGLYGVTAAQALAASCIVIANLERVVERYDEQIPMLHATPATLEETLRKVVGDRDSYRPYIEAGQEFVDRYHDGSYSAAVLLRDLLDPSLAIERYINDLFELD